MKITIDIKDSKAAFFLELLQNFEEFITIEKAEEVVLSKAHKKLLDTRLAKYQKNPKDLLDWDKVQTELEQTL